MVSKHLRWMVEQLREFRSQSGQPATQPDVKDEASKTDSRWAPADDVDVSQLPTLFATDDRAQVQRGLGWLVVLPELPEETAEEIAELCLERTQAETITVKRSAYRGLRAIHRLHPQVVDSRSARVAEGMLDRFVVVRHTCAETLSAMLERNPSTAGAVYPYLLSSNATVREVTFDILLDVAHSHPVVLTAIDPFFKAELREPTIPRPLLIEGLIARSEQEPELLDDVLPALIELLPTTDATLERAIIRAVIAANTVPQHPDPVLYQLLGALSSRDHQQRAQMTAWLDQTLRADPSLGAVVKRWGDEASEWDRLRVLTAVDESPSATLEIVRPLLLQPGDTYADVLSE